jgi:hypothetical protein
MTDADSLTEKSLRISEQYRSSNGKDMEIFMIDKISPDPSLPKRETREELILRCIQQNV